MNKIEKYSDKSFVIRVKNKDKHEESFLALGGTWNPYLTDKKTGEKFGDWIFWNGKREEVNQWVKDGCPKLKKTLNKQIHGHCYKSLNIWKSI